MTKPVTIHGCGLQIGGYTDDLGAYVYHPLFTRIVRKELEALGIDIVLAKNLGGYNHHQAKAAVKRYNDGETLEITRA